MKAFLLSVPALALAASCAAAEPNSLTVASVERLELHIPFYCERVSRNMHRANSHSERVYLYKARLADGSVGWGEAPYDQADRVGRVVGRNALAVVRDDSIGAGIQMALYDAVGRSLGVPVHKLLGRQRRKSVPIAWWDIDMPPEDWAAEVAESVRRGYTSAKIKARPWRDIYAQIDAVARVAPPGYTVGIDFNGFCLDANTAMRVLKPLDANRVVGLYESPFYLQTDPNGARRLTAAMVKLTAEHFHPIILTTECSDVVLVPANYIGVEQTFRLDAQCALHRRPYWLQMVGTGITAAYMAQLGAVLSQATLPAVTCHELYEDDLLTQRLEVVKGMLAVPEGPGLGVEVDEAAIRKYQVAPGTPTAKDKYLEAKRTIRITIPRSGAEPLVLEFPSEKEYYPRYLKGEFPVFVPGVRMEVIESN